MVRGWVPGTAENPTISNWSKATQQVGGSGEKKSNPGSQSFEQTTGWHLKSSSGDEKSYIIIASNVNIFFLK